jgi:hypothetical protein
MLIDGRVLGRQALIGVAAISSDSNMMIGNSFSVCALVQQCIAKPSPRQRFSGLGSMQFLHSFCLGNLLPQ